MSRKQRKMAEISALTCAKPRNGFLGDNSGPVHGRDLSRSHGAKNGADSLPSSVAAMTNEEWHKVGELDLLFQSVLEAAHDDGREGEREEKDCEPASPTDDQPHQRHSVVVPHEASAAAMATTAPWARGAQGGVAFATSGRTLPLPSGSASYIR